jgi:hypothetical protein
MATAMWLSSSMKCGLACRFSVVESARTSKRQSSAGQRCDPQSPSSSYIMGLTTGIRNARQ